MLRIRLPAWPENSETPRVVDLPTNLIVCSRTGSERKRIMESQSACSVEALSHDSTRRNYECPSFGQVETTSSDGKYRFRCHAGGSLTVSGDAARLARTCNPCADVVLAGLWGDAGLLRTSHRPQTVVRRSAACVGSVRMAVCRRGSQPEYVEKACRRPSG